MRKKLILLFFLNIFILSIIFRGSTGVGTINADTITWHEWIAKGLTLHYVVESVEGTPTFGGQVLTAGDNLSIKIASNPSTNYNDLFTDHVQNWLEVYFKGELIDNSMFSPLEIQYLSGFFFPIDFHWDNGSTSTLEEFLAQFTPSLFDTTNYHLASNGWEGVVNWINSSDSTYIEVITALENGVTNWNLLNTESYRFQIRFTGESESEEEEDEESDAPTSIKWSDVITKGTLLAWNITTFIQNTSDSEPFTIGSTIIKKGDIIQFGFVKNPPTNAKDWLDPEGAPDWVKIYINSNEIDINQIGEESSFFQYLVIPVEASFENGTKLYLKDFFDLMIGEDDYNMNYSRIEVNSTYYDVSWRQEWDKGEEDIGFANYFLRSTIASGITIKMDVDASEGHMTWEFAEEAATVDPEKGETKTIESEYSVSLDYPPVELTPGFELIFSVIILAFFICIKRRKK